MATFGDGTVKKVLVLGSGLVGSEIARCLAEEFSVTVVDRDQNNLERLPKEYQINKICMDFAELNTINHLAAKHDITVGAMPSALAYSVLKAIIPASKKIVDISFFPEDPTSLEDLAVRNECSLVIDAGIAPGLNNIILGYEYAQMDSVFSFQCFVGGLPLEPAEPWHYKAPFEVKSVLAVCLEQAKFVEDGQIRIAKPADTVEPYNLRISGIGLESAITDGLRTLLTSYTDIRRMSERTLRYSGFFRKVQDLKDLGFLDGQNNAATIAKLNEDWRLGDDKEFTLMRCHVFGTKDGVSKYSGYQIFDCRDQKTGATSMSRTTGYTCCAIVHLLARSQSRISIPGVIVPEHIGAVEEDFSFILNFLSTRDVSILRSEQIIF